MSDKERELVEYFIKIVEETPSLHEKWINPPIKIATWKHLLELDKRLEDIKIINEEHKILNGMIRKELQQKENIIKEVRETLEDNYGGLSISDYERLIDLCKRSDKE